jgi:hypothetical protein
MVDPHSSSAAPSRPPPQRRLDLLDVAHQPEHEFGLGVSGDDVGLGAAADDAHVVGGLAQHGVGGQRDGAEAREQVDERIDGRAAEVRVGRVRLAAARAHGDAQRALGAARQLALGGLAVDEPAARGRQVVGRARAVGALLLADDEQEVDALLAGAREAVGRAQHGGRDPLRVRAPAAVQAVALQARRVVRRHRVEVRGERDLAAPAGCPHVPRGPA